MTQLLPMMMYCFVMSITPGPNNMMLTASGANFGYRHTLPQILGINAGGFVLTWVSCRGLGQLFLAWPPAHALLAAAGAAYLAWLAWSLARTRVGEAQALRPQSFAEGLLFQAVNPKSWMKAVTLASVFMPTDLPPASAALLVSVVGWVIGFPCVSCWALFGVALRGLLREPRNQRVFNLLMAGTLVALAVSMLRGG